MELQYDFYCYKLEGSNIQSKGRWNRNMYSMGIRLNCENLVLLLGKSCFS